MSEKNYFELAKECVQNGKIDEAIDNYKKEIEQNPASTAAILNLVLLLKKVNSPEIEEYFNMGIALSPNDDRFYAIIGEFYLKNGYKEYALMAFNDALKIVPDKFEYQYNVATILYKMGNYPKACELYEKLSQKAPDNVSILLCLAQTYRHLVLTDKALEIHKHCYELKPDDEKIKFSLAIAYNRSNQPQEALKLFEEMIDTYPDKIEIYRGIGISYSKMQKYNIAFDYFQKALDINPDDVESMLYIAKMYMYFDKEDTSEMLVDKILEKYPDNDSAIHYKNIIKLRHKDFSGFENISGPEKAFKGSGPTFYYMNKAWNGEDIKDKTVFVTCNCGIGDTIMFARYLPELFKMTKKVILDVNKPLTRIFKDNFKKCEIVTDFQNLEFDYMLNMALLPYYMKSGSKLPKGKNSLKVNKKFINDIEKFDILNTHKKKIAFVWRGTNVFLERKITLDVFSSLFEVDAQFYSFQLDATDEEKAILSKYPNIVEMKPYISDYADTAAFLTKMDRVISVDTSLIHMAGVVGVVSYLILPFEQEWRWYGGKNNISPWYETVKMFRQAPDCNWSKVIEKVKNELVRNLYNAKI